MKPPRALDAAEAATPHTYEAAGVSIAVADEAVRRLAPHARSTYRPEVLSDIGAFGAVTALPPGLRDPVLVSANDGAGTKPLIAAALGRWDTIGIDVVAMCVDDIVTLAAQPLLFHDQITAGRLDPDIVEAIVSGLATGCRSAGCALVGGELAEHPDSLAPGEFDVAGFAVGVAQRAHLPSPLSGDRLALVGLASGGLRCNGYSLARRVLCGRSLDAAQLGEPCWPGADRTLGDELLQPSVIYAPAVLSMFRDSDARGAAHITGGGLAANVARMLSPHADALLRRGTWPEPAIFGRIAGAGPVSPAEMERVFNLGIGMVVAVPTSNVGVAIDSAHAGGHDAWVVGEIRSGTGVAHLVGPHESVSGRNS
ncbi:phosphoribosylformylglycinamidine cyclo-ligase [Candidatus Poriferisodalis sp.]|uniref:phosphoribosylformylglycinamidine cyclo-ligase n=1 Tax=Candidatus Poriferisodalis sp. TaxID=3101277 RepID=UPI003B025E85